MRGGGNEASEVEAVVLAAGFSSRCAEYKMALRLGSRSVIARTVDALSAFCSRVIVVVGWREDEVRSLLASRTVEYAPNPHHATGMFSSVRAGVELVRGGRFFVQPGDIPLVGADVYARLIETPGDVVVPTHRGRGGHPVLLAREVAESIRDAPADATLRDVLVAYDEVRVPVEDEAILWDIDTMADYARLARELSLRQGASNVDHRQ